MKFFVLLKETNHVSSTMPDSKKIALTNLLTNINKTTMTQRYTSITKNKREEINPSEDHYRVNIIGVTLCLVNESRTRVACERK